MSAPQDTDGGTPPARAARAVRGAGVRLLVLAGIARRGLNQHALSTVVTALSAALASGLVLAVFAVSAQTREAFTSGALGIDAVLGARGSPLQLVLNTVFHLETSPGNLPWSTYEAVRADPRVARAIPYAVGDSYRGFRVVGTTPERFELEGADGRPLLRVAPGGRVFDPGRREAVLGASVARRAGLGVGSHFHPEHGVGHRGGEDHEHEEEYVVVGVLEPTSSPSDRVVWIPIEGVFRMGGHVLRGAGSYVPRPGEAIPDEHKEVSAVLLKFRGRQAGFQLAALFNQEERAATLAWPVAASMAEVFDKLGWLHRVLELVAYLVVAVAAGSILASLYNAMGERRREFAILRALGARRRAVFGVIVLESTAIAALGAALGYLVYMLVLAAAAVLVRRSTGVVLDPFFFHPALVVVPLAMVGLGVLAGLLPAWRAYSTDVARGLSPTS